MRMHETARSKSPLQTQAPILRPLNKQPMSGRVPTTLADWLRKYLANGVPGCGPDADPLGGGQLRVAPEPHRSPYVVPHTATIIFAISLHGRASVSPHQVARGQP